MRGLASVILDAMQDGKVWTSAGMAHHLYGEYVVAAPTSSECEAAMDFLARRGRVGVRHGGQFGPEYQVIREPEPEEQE